MLTTADFLNICLGFGFLILTGFIAFTLYQISLTFAVIRKMIIDIKLLKEGMKISFLSIVNTLLGGR
jgi:hypothetical protein